MLQPSFVPPAAIRVLRDYTRLRVDLTRERSRYWQRLEKLLEDACLRCPLLRPDPTLRGRLAEVRTNLHDRIGEAEREGWTGEAEGLKVSLAAASHKLAQMDGITARRRATPVHLGMPGHFLAASRTVTTPATLPGHTR